MPYGTQSVGGAHAESGGNAFSTKRQDRVRSFSTIAISVFSGSWRYTAPDLRHRLAIVLSSSRPALVRGSPPRIKNVEIPAQKCHQSPPA